MKIAEFFNEKESYINLDYKTFEIFELKIKLNKLEDYMGKYGK